MSAANERIILVVDDDDDVRDVVADILRDEGYPITEARTAAEAAETARRSPPSLVLLDWVLPDDGSGSLIERLRAEHGAALPVVLLSGFPDLGERGRAMGATGVLAKPFHFDELLRCVSSLCPSGGS